MQSTISFLFFFLYCFYAFELFGTETPLNQQCVAQLLVDGSTQQYIFFIIYKLQCLAVILIHFYYYISVHYLFSVLIIFLMHSFLLQLIMYYAFLKLLYLFLVLFSVDFCCLFSRSFRFTMCFIFRPQFIEHGVILETLLNKMVAMSYIFIFYHIQL